LTGDLTTILIFMAIFFISCLIMGMTSFGFAMIAVPLLNLFFPLQTLVPILILYSVIMNLILLLPLYNNLQLNNMVYLVLAGIIGTPLGTFLLLALDESILKITIGMVIIIFAWTIYTGHTINIKNEKVGNLTAGLLSGILNGSITMSGPPIILLYNNNKVEKQIFRANLALYFLILSIMTVPSLYFYSLLTPQVVHYALVNFPALVAGGIGILIGSKIGNKINNEVFTRLTLILVSIMGLLSVFSSL
jgi:uncharacterized membrane protein YfcA